MPKDGRRPNKRTGLYRAQHDEIVIRALLGEVLTFTGASDKHIAALRAQVCAAKLRFKGGSNIMTRISKDKLTLTVQLRPGQIPESLDSLPVPLKIDA